MNANIDIFGAYSRISGDFPVAEIQQETSYLEPGAMYSLAYKKKRWDGRKHLFNKKTGQFPTGLLATVTKLCDDLGYPYTITDHRLSPNPDNSDFDLKGISMTGKYDFQMQACLAAIKHKQGILKIATSGGKTNIACAITKYLGLKTLFIVPTVELLFQSRDRFASLLDIDKQDPCLGVIGDGEWNPGTWITFALFPTLESRLAEEACLEFMSEIDVLFLDEAHQAGAETYFTVAMICPAYYRIALSATPLDRTDGANLRLIAATGEVLIDIPNKLLVERGIVAKADIVWDKITEPVLPSKCVYMQAYKAGVSDNEQMLAKVTDWAKHFHAQGLNTLIMVEEIAQGNAIDDALWNSVGKTFIPHSFVNGDESTETRAKALKDFDARKINVLIASRIFDQGIDCHQIDALILAGSRKSKIRTLQRLGRGLRGSKLIVVEFANYTHKYLARHSLERLQDYKAEDCFNIRHFKEGQDKAELIAKLWKGQDK